MVSVLSQLLSHLSQLLSQKLHTLRDTPGRYAATHLQERRVTHVPFRNSKLTQLLQESGSMVSCEAQRALFVDLQDWPVNSEVFCSIVEPSR